ncbi:50S ribosomal protein L13 [Citrobacter freundii]|uniref:50S ribosomal protein L13 n=1 Tax=Citrobacter freundii TaxID=546 RepID=UPI000B5AA97B|nr:50S ribosomal protein L13 [Citrobacter freundii]ASK00141.1 50S ribosomal protein L13 [Citrobacter freundii]OYQ91802.1 50S ribosomal protein L13 [Citrobacter freundii]
MTYKSVTEGKPKPFTRVWVMTDTGRETTGHVKSDGEWFINCAAIRATGALVLRWREG